jgi:hypothetical protein
VIARRRRGAVHWLSRRNAAKAVHQPVVAPLKEEPYLALSYAQGFPVAPGVPRPRYCYLIRAGAASRRGVNDLEVVALQRVKARAGL